VTVVDDTASEGNETVNLTLSSPTGGATLGTINTAILTIVDNEASLDPAPIVTTLSPAVTSAGAGAFTLTVSGSNFVSGSEVRWNGAARPTTFVSSTQLTAAIPTSDIAIAGTAQVSVFNSSSGISNSLSFSITSTACTTGQYLAEYFNNISLNGSPTFTACQSSINYNWGSGGPGNGLANDNFSVRWTGQVEAPVTGNYTFSTVTDDGVRLWVNGVLRIDRWTNNAPTTNTSAPISLIAGMKYSVVMEYYERKGGAVARLRWAYPGQGTQAIPQPRLFP